MVDIRLESVYTDNVGSEKDTKDDLRRVRDVQ